MVPTESIIPAAMPGVTAATSWAIQHPDFAAAPGIELPSAKTRLARGYFGSSTHTPQDAVP